MNRSMETLSFCSSYKLAAPRLTSHRFTAMMSLQDDLLEEVFEVQENKPHRQVLYINAFHRNLDHDFYYLLGESMIGNTHLLQLCLDRVLLNELGARALAHGIRQSKLQKVELSCYVKFKDNEEIEIPQRILYKGIQASQTIETIVLRDFRPEHLSCLGDVLSSMPVLKNLRISHAYVHREPYAQLLSKVLSKAPSLVELQLRRCCLKGDSITPLARALQNNRPLRSLELTDCIMDDRSVGILLEHWQCDSSIQRLVLSGNRIGSLGVQVLLNAAQEHQALRELNLSGNADIGYQGLRMIGNDLPHQPNLRAIYLEKCVVVDDVGNGSVKSSKKKQIRKKTKAELALLNGIRNNHSVLELRVDGNAFRGQLCGEVAFYTDLNRFGRYLLSTNHGLASTVWCRIFGNCNKRCCADLIYYFLREQPHLMQHIVQPKTT